MSIEDNKVGFVPYVLNEQAANDSHAKTNTHTHTDSDLENIAQVQNAVQEGRYQTICSLSVEQIVHMKQVPY
jgi:hypothetical protein